MPNFHYLQTTFNAGVLDPRLAARLDIRQFYQGLSLGENVICIPSGGLSRRPGLKYLDTLPNIITRVTSGVTPTAPEGGTAANANDNDTATEVQTTGNVGTVDPYIVVKYDLGSAKTIKFADVVGMYSTGGNTDQFKIQYSTDDSTWTSLTGLETIDTTSRTYRRLASVSARYWRVAKIGGADMGAVNIRLGEFTLWEESATLSESVARPFSFNTEQDYAVVFTDYNVRIYQNGVRVADVRSPYPSADLAEIDWAQSGDTMVMVHEDYAPQRLLRGTVSTVWTVSPVTFTAVPQYDYNDSNSPTPTSCVQTVTFTTYSAGNKYLLTLDNAETEDIVFAGDANADQRAATASNMQKAIQALYNTGFSGVSVVRTNTNEYTVTFAGESADNFGVMAGTTVSGSGSIACVLVTPGVARKEDVWSATRGWPRSVTFFEGRLYFGGTRSIPQAVFASVSGDFFNFGIGEGLDSDAIFTVINAYQLNAITGLYPGRDLQVFTTGGEFRYPDDVITPGSVPKNQTQYGSAKTKAISIDGATLFVQRNRKTIRDFLYSFNEDAYNSAPVTILAPHLLNNIVEMAAYQGSGDDESNFVYVVNGDGTIACHSTLRSQEVTAWSKWTTDGLFKSVAVVNEDRYVITRRSINGTSYNFFEEMKDTHFLDSSVLGTQASSATISGLSHLNGATVGVRTDYLVLSDEAVSGGAITADQAVTSFEVGLRFSVTMRTMPLNGNYGNGDFLLRRKRIVKAYIYVYQSLGMLMNDRVLTDRAYDIDSFDESPDPITKTHIIEESTNWSEEPLYLTISQTDPLPFTVLGIDIKLEVS